MFPKLMGSVVGLEAATENGTLLLPLCSSIGTTKQAASRVNNERRQLPHTIGLCHKSDLEGLSKI